jgi:hypothetical protein
MSAQDYLICDFCSCNDRTIFVQGRNLYICNVCIEYCAELWQQHQQRAMADVLLGESPDGLAERVTPQTESVPRESTRLLASPRCAFCGDSVGVYYPTLKVMPTLCDDCVVCGSNPYGKSGDLALAERLEVAMAEPLLGESPDGMAPDSWSTFVFPDEFANILRERSAR